MRSLVVVSSALHYRVGDGVAAYAPYVREIEVWAELFPRVVIAAPLGTGSAPADCAVIARANVLLAGFPPTGGTSAASKVWQFAMLPFLALRMVGILRRADAVHVRCPGNLGLLGVVLAPLFSSRLVAKYAGQWTGYPGEPASVRLQRRVLRSRWWRGPVTVYGDWPDQPEHVVPFFTSVLDRAQVERAARAAREVARPRQPVRLLFVGRLSPEKHPEAIVDACANLAQRGVPAQGRIIGHGPIVAELEARAREVGADVAVEGALPFEAVLDAYEWADVLVLASESEGWPKAITEAMAFGVACIGSDRGLVPSILGEGRGVVVNPGDSIAVADAVASLAADHERLEAISERASAWAAGHSLEGLGEALRELLEQRWHVRLGDSPGSRPSVIHLIDSLESGGAERVAVELANGLAGRGYFVSLVSTRSEGPLAALVSPAVRRLCLNRRHALDPRGALQLRRHIRAADGPVVLHAHSTSLFLATGVAFSTPGVRVVWHDHFGRLESGEARSARVFGLAARRAATVLSVSSGLRDWACTALGVEPARVRTIPNPAIATLPAGPPPNLPPGRPRLVCVANLRPEKDHAGLIEALAGVVAAHPAAHLVLAGAGSDGRRAELADLVARLGLTESVSILGHVEDVPALLASCDLAVLGSRSEAFPLALLDYGMAGLPVIATDVGDCREVLDGGRAGILVPPGAPGALAEAVIDLFADDHRRKAIATALADRVRTRYSLDAVLDELEQVYDAAVSEA